MNSSVRACSGKAKASSDSINLSIKSLQKHAKLTNDHYFFNFIYFLIIIVIIRILKIFSLCIWPQMFYTKCPILTKYHII